MSKFKIFTKPINRLFQIRGDKVQEFLSDKGKHTTLLTLERAEKHKKKLKDGKGISL